MGFSWQLLISVTLGYLLLLFLAAYCAERGWIPQNLARHPLVYLLALGVYCSAFAYYGSVGLAYHLGYGYLALYLGLAIALVFSAIILRPIHDQSE